MIDITRKADEISRLANADYWSVLLSAFQLAAFQHGFDFSKEWEPCVLDKDEKQDLGRSLVAARRLYLMPNSLAHAEGIEYDVMDGYAESLVDSVISSLISCGIHLTRKPEMPQISLSSDKPRYEGQTVFAKVICRKALSLVESLEKNEHTWHEGISYGMVLGYLDALLDLGLIPMEAKKELVYQAEVAYHRNKI